ncbi:MAG: hypothetical protein LBQ12_12385 [Deltaproteobacteria bacterium]|jgi:excinuclease ABC subunit A|nr:hypothetical protein [Deltaproteobacteria bacterium]
MEMHVLPDALATREVRGGARLRDTLDVKYARLSISDILNLAVSETQAFFRSVPALKEKLRP